MKATIQQEKEDHEKNQKKLAEEVNKIGEEREQVFDQIEKLIKDTKKMDRERTKQLDRTKIQLDRELAREVKQRKIVEQRIEKKQQDIDYITK